MAHFEILIPRDQGIPNDITLQVEADDWLSALRQGLAKVGQDGAAAENVLCDIMQDNSIHVTDTTTGRVFKIVEMDIDDEDNFNTIPEMPGVEDTAVTIPEMPAGQLQDKTIPARSLARIAEDEPESQDAVLPTATSSGIGRAIDFTSESTADLLQEVFDLSQKVQDKSDTKEALDYVLDLAMDTIGTDSGSVFLADINSDELRIGTARGPKADEVMGIGVKMGQGIVGFCAETAVGMAVSDANRDHRFYKQISEKIGYPTKSILCVPIQAEGQVMGAMELINKKTGSTFTERDLGVANFLGQQLAQYLEGSASK